MEVDTVADQSHLHLEASPLEGTPMSEAHREHAAILGLPLRELAHLHHRSEMAQLMIAGLVHLIAADLLHRRATDWNDAPTHLNRESLLLGTS